MCWELSTCIVPTHGPGDVICGAQHKVKMWATSSEIKSFKTVTAEDQASTRSWSCALESMKPPCPWAGSQTGAISEC